MPNDNYCAALTAFTSSGSDAYYIAGSASPFNALNLAGGFAAYVTFILRGASQNVVSPVNQFLWGNLTGNNGWAFQLTQGNQAQLLLQCILGDGSGTNVTAFRLTSDSNVDPAFQTGNPIERLIMAGLWYTGEDLYMTINGAIVALAEDVDLALSSVPARIGIAPDGSIPCTTVDIVSVGYSNNLNLTAAGGDPTNVSPLVGDFAGNAFAAARDTMNSGPINRDAGLDWVRRYEARQSAEGAVGVITKGVTTAKVAIRAAGPAPLNDIGNQTYATAIPSFTPVTVAPEPLTRVSVTSGPLVFPQVVGRKNVDWYAGGTPIVPVPD